MTRRRAAAGLAAEAAAVEAVTADGVAAQAAAGGVAAEVPVRLARRRHTLILVVVLAVGSAGAGWWAGRGIESPDEAARNASAPPASPITVPVELRELATAVVVRGDVTFAQAVDVSVDADIGDRGAGAAGGTAVVTGRVPKAGDELAEGDLAVEVAGRPVFLLAGALPMYRALRPGSTGADVRQLEQALKRLGHFTGTPDTVYDGQTQTAVTALYRDHGYEPVGPSTEEKTQLTAAETQVKTATAALRQAEAALETASRPPAHSAVLAARNAVDQARAAVRAAAAARDAAVSSGADQAAIAAREAELTAAKNQLAVAQAQLDELTAPKDTRAQERAVQDAKAQLASADAALRDLKKTFGVRVPHGEVVFVPSLPRRVDKVSAALGKPATGPVLSLTGADLQIEASVSLEEQRLVKPGMPVRLDEEASGVELTGKVVTVADKAGTDGAPAGSYYLLVKPAGRDLAKLAGLNLRVTVPIKSTAGKVLAVPQAALVTDAAGAVRVRVAREAGFSDVTVAVGLAADGFAEVRPVDGELAEGDLVTVGSRQ